MTAETLKTYRLKELTQLAKDHGVSGWKAMRKEELIKALLRTSRAGAKKSSGTSKKTSAALSSKPSSSQNGKPVAQKEIRQDAAEKARRTRVLKKLELAKVALDKKKNLAFGCNSNSPNEPVVRDRLVVMVRDPFWLHAYWELSRQGVERAQAALGQDWHSAIPVLRLYEVSAGGATNASEKLLRDIEIHGGVKNWYVDVDDPPRSYRLDVGYLSATGKYFSLARSNMVTTPKAGFSDSLDENWTDVAENYEKIFAMNGGASMDGPSMEIQELFEERLRRPMGAPIIATLGQAIEGLVGKRPDFHFELDAELIVFGKTEADAHVTLAGDPVKIRQDGTFTVRFSLPNCRQVIPAIASSATGLEQRTIVLAIERNTKTMEPINKENGD